MPTWGEFEAAAPERAAAGRRLIYSRGDGLRAMRAHNLSASDGSVYLR